MCGLVTYMRSDSRMRGQTKVKNQAFLHYFEKKLPLGVNKKGGTEYIYSRVGEGLKQFGATKAQNAV